MGPRKPRKKPNTKAHIITSELPQNDSSVKPARTHPKKPIATKPPHILRILKKLNSNTSKIQHNDDPVTPRKPLKNHSTKAQINKSLGLLGFVSWYELEQGMVLMYTSLSYENKYNFERYFILVMILQIEFNCFSANPVKVMAVDGHFFHVSAASWYIEFGQTGEVYIEQAGSQTWIGKIFVWKDTEDIVKGRREPYSESGPGQWEKGDTIKLIAKLSGKHI